MKKWILRIVIVLIAIVVIGLLVVYFSLNSLVKWGVERGGTQATGQNTALQMANLSLSGGSLDLGDLGIDNVKGYTTPTFLKMKDCQISVQSGSLFTSNVVVPSITIDGLELTVEQNGMKNNLADILSAIKAHTAAGGGEQPPGKKLSIGMIKLTGTKVHMHVLADLTLDLGPIEIKDPTNPDGRPMKIADVIGKVLINVAAQIANDPRVPAAFKDGLKNVNQLLDQAQKLIPADMKDLQKNLPKGLEGLNPFNKKDSRK